MADLAGRGRERKAGSGGVKGRPGPGLTPVTIKRAVARYHMHSDTLRVKPRREAL